jgi:hypothetical protein
MLILMVEAHQRISDLRALPVSELMEWAEGVQAIINHRNTLARGDQPPPPGGVE